MTTLADEVDKLERTNELLREQNAVLCSNLLKTTQQYQLMTLREYWERVTDILRENGFVGRGPSDAAVFEALEVVVQKYKKLTTGCME